jgi:2-haloacid dehalogenase
VNKRPKYISFDCYGTLINFAIGDMTREVFADRVTAERMDRFVKDFRSYRFDEVTGAWKPYADVLATALERTCRRWKLPYKPEEGRRFYEAVPTWGPHPDVAAPLARIAKEIPLVILSNAANEQIHQNVAKLGAPFHAVFTAEQARAYKPRYQAFEYMLDRLACSPDDMLHVSSSLRYDLMTADDLGFRNKAFVARGHDFPNPAYNYREIRDIGGLPALVGL